MHECDKQLVLNKNDLFWQTGFGDRSTRHSSAIVKLGRSSINWTNFGKEKLPLLSHFRKIIKTICFSMQIGAFLDEPIIIVPNCKLKTNYWSSTKRFQIESASLYVIHIVQLSVISRVSNGAQSKILLRNISWVKYL